MSERDLLLKVCAVLENAGNALYRNPRNSRVLRLLQERITSLTKTAKIEELIFLNHFLSDYIDRLWFNMAVDFTYEANRVGKEALDGLVKKIGKNLENLAEALRVEDEHERVFRFHELCSELVKIYQSKLKELMAKKRDIELGRSPPAKIKKYDIIEQQKRELFKALEKYGVITKSEYSLAAGTESNYFFDIDRIVSESEGVTLVSDWYTKKINEVKRRGVKIDKLAFMEKDVGTVGALPFLSSIVSGTKTHAFVVRLRKEVPIGVIKCSYNMEPKKDEHVAIIGDVATSGGGIMKTAKIIWQQGSKVPCAFVLYDREQGAKEILKRNKIELVSIITRTELLEVGFINPFEHTDFTKIESSIIPPAEWKLEKLKKLIGPESTKFLESKEFSEE